MSAYGRRWQRIADIRALFDRQGILSRGSTRSLDEAKRAWTEKQAAVAALFEEWEALEAEAAKAPD